MVSIIELSIRPEEKGKVRFLRLGVDDYVVKPFGMLELLARSEAVLRRYLKNETCDPLVKVGQLTVYLVTRMVSVVGRRVKLTRMKYALLHTLATHTGLVVIHQQLMKEVWGVAGDNMIIVFAYSCPKNCVIKSKPTQHIRHCLSSNRAPATGYLAFAMPAAPGRRKVPPKGAAQTDIASR